MKLTGIAAQTSKSKSPSSEHSMVVPSTAFKSCINGGRGGGGKWNFGGGPGPSHASSPHSKKSLSNIFHIKMCERYRCVGKATDSSKSYGFLPSRVIRLIEAFFSDYEEEQSMNYRRSMKLELLESGSHNFMAHLKC